MKIALAAFTALVLASLASAYGASECLGPAGCTGNSSIKSDYVMATGEATVSVDSTVMIAHLDFVGRDSTARDAYNEQAETMARVISLLRERGVTEMTTASLAIEPIYGERKNDPYWHSDYSDITSYRVHNTLVIKARNQSMFDGILVDSIDLGVNKIGSMRFIPDKDAIKKAKMRVKEEALQDAKKNAKWQAGILKRTLKDIVYVGDAHDEIIQPNPYGWHGNTQMMSNVATQTSLYLSQGSVEEVESLSPGTMTFKAQVTVGYLI